MDPRGAALLDPLPADLDGRAWRQARSELLAPQVLGHRRDGSPIYQLKGGMRQYWVAPLPPFHTADGATVGGTAALTDASPTPPLVLPANMLEQGSRLEFSCFGRFTSTATPGTIVVGIYLGTGAIAAGQAVAASAAIIPVASQTNRTWRLEGNASIRTVGAGTAATILGALEISNITANGTDMAPATAPTALGFDSTIANTIRVGLTPSVTTGTWVVHYFGVRLVN
jgi:hypothetical protein